MFNIYNFIDVINKYKAEGAEFCPMGVRGTPSHTFMETLRLKPEQAQPYPLPIDVSLEIERSQKVLKALRLIDPGASLWGGAPRNWFFRRKANDVDIFIYTGRDMSTEDMQRWLDAALLTTGYDLKVHRMDETPPPVENNNDLYSYDSTIVDVYEVSLHGTPFQIIHCNEPVDERVETSPVNMSSIHFDGEQIVIGLDFYVGVFTSTLYLLREPLGREGAYIGKIAGYFPRYILCQTDEQLAATMNEAFPGLGATPDDPFAHQAT